METFDIKKVIKKYSLKEEDVADVLFPNVRYKKMALDRVLKGETCLDTKQLQALANLAGVFIFDLFQYNDWTGQSEDGHLVFKNGEYIVKLQYKGVKLSVYKGTKLVYDELNLSNMNVEDFFQYLNKLIENGSN